MSDFETRVAEAKRTIRDRSPAGIQRRSMPAVMEIRSAADNGYTIAGHGAVYNVLSADLGGFREKIEPGAFNKVLASTQDPKALVNHNPDLVLGSVRAGTLRLSDDGVGLAFRVDAPAGVYYADALRVLLERGDVHQSSFAFRITRGAESWEDDPATGLMIRTIHQFSELFDVSVVTYPAYAAADSHLSSLSQVGEQAKGDGQFPLRAAVARSLERHAKQLA